MPRTLKYKVGQKVKCIRDDIYDSDDVFNMTGYIAKQNHSEVSSEYDYLVIFYYTDSLGDTCEKEWWVNELAISPIRIFKNKEEEITCKISELHTKFYNKQLKKGKNYVSMQML